MKTQDVIKCKRISIIGSAGSGKSTLAVKLGELLNLPICHSDRFCRDTVASDLAKIEITDKWIIDGTVRETIDNRFARADIIVFLNIPIDVCQNGIIKRYNNNEHIGKPDNPTMNEQDFMKYCLKNIKTWHERNVETIALLKSKYKDKVIELKTREQVDKFIEELQKKLKSF